jgi:hypothetical protein
MDFNVKSIDEKIWERARIKGIREKVSLSTVFRALIKMWIDGEVTIKLPGKGKRKGKQSVRR